MPSRPPWLGGAPASVWVRGHRVAGHRAAKIQVCEASTASMGVGPSGLVSRSFESRHDGGKRSGLRRYVYRGLAGGMSPECPGTCDGARRGALGGEAFRGFDRRRVGLGWCGFSVAIHFILALLYTSRYIRTRTLRVTAVQSISLSLTFSHSLSCKLALMSVSFYFSL